MDVYIIGSYCTQFRKWSDKTHKQLTEDAFMGTLKDAGLETGADIETAWFGNCNMYRWGQGSIRGQVCFIPLVKKGLFPERAPIINVEGACATGSMAFHGAWKDILSGQTSVSLAIGVEKIYNPDWDYMKMFESFQSGIDNFDPKEWMAVYEEFANKCGKTFDPKVATHTIFMETYAIQACQHIKKWETSRRQMAIVASKNHYHGSLNPKAQYQFELSVDEVLADRPITFPLTRAMCAPISDGAAASILCSESYLKTLPKSVQERAVKIRSSVLTGGKYRDPEEPGLSRVAAEKAYKIAGVEPKDIDVAEVHDATSYCEIYQTEMLGFCPDGQGGPFAESGATSLGGKIPINTSGGLESMGHPVGATGLAMVYELVMQLRHEAGPRQVPNARLGLQQNGGGLMGLEEAACSVMILEKTP